MMNSVRRYVVTGLVVCPIWLGAQTNGPTAPTYPSNRYLLVLETSRAMQKDSGMFVQTVKDLLSSALASQARRGDTLGVWTFDERLHTGRLPLQEWAPQNQQAITQRILGLLEAQKFDQASRLDSVLPPLLHLVRDSRFLTVILVCAGDQEVHGTPFDQRINAFFQNWRQHQLEARTPFVVALRAQAGTFVDCAMNPAPWPVELPVLPKELFVALPPPKPPPPKTAPPKKIEVPPLIVIGKKHEPAAVPTNESTVQARPPAIVSAAHNVGPPSQVNQQLLRAPGPGEPAPAIPSGSSSAPGLASSLASAAPTQSPSRTEPQSTELKVNGPTPSTTTPAPATQHTLAESPMSSAASLALKTAQPTVAEDRPASPAHMNALPVSVATTQPIRDRSNRLLLWITGSGLLVVGLAALWVWRRHARASQEMSLITESIDRRRR